jgi:hypothetical protein
MTSLSASGALDTLGRPPQRSVDRAIAVHECGHAVVGLLRKLLIINVVLGDNIGGTIVQGHGEIPTGLLQMLYAGYCAEVEFGIDPAAARRSSRSDIETASLLFPSHSPSIEVAKTRSIVHYHRDVIHRASQELLVARRLGRDAILKLLEDA